MANPRKFSEKIALHNQKQAEETAAFEAILRDVAASTRNKPQQAPPQPHHLQQPLGNFRGGSLPNVNQIPGNNSLDLQAALGALEDMKQNTTRQSLVDRCYRERGRQVQPHRGRGPYPFDKRIDTSPYGSPYLSPPAETSWRRTNSDSAIHRSAMTPPQQHQQQQQRSITPQGRVEMQQGDGQLKVDGNQLWDPKNPNGQSRPKSCEVPGINIYPSPDHEGGGVHIPISNNTGSLPDLSNLHFPPPLTTPLDAEEGASYPAGSPGNLSPTSMHHMGGVHHGQQASPGASRRHNHGAPSPLVIHGSPTQMRQNIQGNALDVSSLHQSYHPYHIQQTSPQMQRLRPASTSPVSTSRIPTNHTGALPPGRGNSLSPNNHNQTHLNVNSHIHTAQGSMSQYRSNQTSDCPQSPTSPHSQPSYSPSQSPGLPPTTLSSSPFSEAYYQQQQAQTNALQHQFEQFNMLQDTTAVTTNGTVSMYNQQSIAGGVHLSQAAMADVSEFNHNPYYSQSPQQPSSPQQHSPQASPSPVSVSAPTGIPPSPTQPTDLSFNPGQGNKIPDIILTGADDLRPDFAKEISNAMAGMPDSFDSDLFLSDELKDGLDPLDLQMLTDPTINVTDPATEDSFRMDRL